MPKRGALIGGLYTEIGGKYPLEVPHTVICFFFIPITSKFMFDEECFGDWWCVHWDSGEKACPEYIFANRFRLVPLH